MVKLNGERNTLKNAISVLKTLTLMQLKEKLDMSYLGNFRKTLFKIVWLVIEFAVITAVCALVFYFIKILNVFSLTADVPSSVMVIIFTVMLALSIVFSTLGLVKSLYFSKDNSVLLTLPATPSLIFLSKLAVYYCYELKKNFMFTVPLFIGYGIIKGLTFAYYPWVIFLFVFISAIPVLISALLSIPSMFVYQFINRFKIVQYVLYAVVAIALGGLAWYLISLIPANINFIETWGTTFWEIQDFLTAFTTTLSFMTAFTELIVGKTVGITVAVFSVKTIYGLLILIGVTVALIVLCFLLAKPLFYKMASTPFEFTKKSNIKEKKNVQRDGFLSALYKETLIGLRSNYFIKLSALLMVVMPLAVLLLNKLYAAMNTRYVGMQMTVAFTAVIMLLILLSTNIDIASIYSRDGSTAYLNKVQPTNYGKLLFSKLVANLVISLIGVFITTFVYKPYCGLNSVDFAMFSLGIYAFHVCHMFWSAELDIMNPQYSQYATFNDQANNPNENMSGVILMIMSVLVFIVSLLLSMNETSGVWIKVGVLAIVLAVAKIFTFFLKIKVFYKEKI